MLTITKSQVIDALHAVDLHPGDGVMIHSAIQFLGQPEGGLGLYVEALRDVLGEEGTFVVPTFNFGFARGEVFGLHETPSDGMGALAEFIRLLPEAKRSTHPMHSVAVVGKYADEIAACDTPGAFDDGSVFDKLVELDFKLLLLGAGVQYTTMIHYCEQRANVPYRYWKEFTGTVKLPDREPETRTIRMFARDLKLDPQVSAVPVQRELEKRGQWSSVKLNYGKVAACRFRDFNAAAMDLLNADPWVLVENRPNRKG
jgi:aminoglycoside 3-N-acetyltransferase